MTWEIFFSVSYLLLKKKRERERKGNLVKKKEGGFRILDQNSNHYPLLFFFKTNIGWNLIKKIDNFWKWRRKGDKGKELLIFK